MQESEFLENDFDALFYAWKKGIEKQACITFTLSGQSLKQRLNFTLGTKITLEQPKVAPSLLKFKIRKKTKDGYCLLHLG